MVENCPYCSKVLQVQKNKTRERLVCICGFSTRWGFPFLKNIATSKSVELTQKLFDLKKQTAIDAEEIRELKDSIKKLNKGSAEIKKTGSLKSHINTISGDLKKIKQDFELKKRDLTFEIKELSLKNEDLLKKTEELSSKNEKLNVENRCLYLKLGDFVRDNYPTDVLKKTNLPITDKQKNLLKVCMRFIRENGAPPTMRELSLIVKRNISSITEMLSAIEDKGYIVRSGKNRRDWIIKLKGIENEKI